ncbi:MAG TPA: ABA4-like family protein [Bryobacteraceae bacterium]|jgi:hypothetical protein|nr:ABA4-like family protein [Bryobacteraceae bacterium]
MGPEQLFRVCNLAALAGWLVLVFFGRRRWASGVLTGIAIPLAFGVLYAVLIAIHYGETPGGFGTLEGVASLFTNHWMLLAGWIHYLAFDLFIGSWEVRDAQKRGVNHLLVIPSLALTFMFGPAGLVLYFLTRTASIRTGGLRPGRVAQL